MGRTGIMASGDVRAFGGVSGVGLPLKLINPLDAEGEQFRNIVWRATYDAEGRVVRVEKRVQGAIHLVHRYAYGTGGRLERAEIEMDEDITVVAFDADGKPIRS